MSRIDAALRRASGNVGAAPVPHAPGDVFVSAWEGPVVSEGPVEPSPVDVPDPAALLVSATGGDLPKLGSRWGERIASSSECDPALVEQFRRIAGTLHNAQAASGIRLVLVSSASPGEGKTLTAINLALVLSETYGRRVLLIDADLRRPSISDVVEVTGSVGLSAALKASTDQKLAVIPLTPTLTLLPAGPADPDPLSGLVSQRMRRILQEAASRFDWVIIDGPPIGALADARLLAQMAEGTILVVRAGQTPHASVEKAVESIGRDRILGVVLNGAIEATDSMDGPYYRQNRPDTATP